MPDHVILASSFTRVGGISTNVATARATATENDAVARVGNSFSTPNYIIRRVLAKFDLSVVPSDEEIVAAQFSASISEDNSATDFDIQIAPVDWSAWDPIASGNRDAAYDAARDETAFTLWRSTAGISINTAYVSGDLDLAYILDSQPTLYLALRTSRDKAGTTPSGLEQVGFNNVGHGTAALRPTLLVQTKEVSGFEILTKRPTG